MSVDERPGLDGHTATLSGLFAEAERQLNICNACRYCEGFCAVFPSLQRRTVLSRGDLVQIANVCHDCRACFQACMYTAPHEFALNPPEILSAVRLSTYEDYVWPTRLPAFLRGWAGIALPVLTSLLVVALVTLLFGHPDNVFNSPDGAFSPYEIIPYWPTILLVSIPLAIGGLIALSAAYRYWMDVDGRLSRMVDLPSIGRAIYEAATLRQQRGGGLECFYPDEEQPSAERRWLHYAVFWGFLLTVAATTAAGIYEHFLDSPPPHDLISAPVIFGTVGGVALLIGSIGMLRLKKASAKELAAPRMTFKDYGLIVALLLLAGTGLLTLVVRWSAAFGIVYVVHLAAVVLAFAAFPYSKFIHVPFRFLALVKDVQERAADKGQVRSH